jgi:hypothetical protein
MEPDGEDEEYEELLSDGDAEPCIRAPPPAPCATEIPVQISRTTARRSVLPFLIFRPVWVIVLDSSCEEAQPVMRSYWIHRDEV